MELNNKIFIVEGKSDTNKLQSIFPEMITIETGGNRLSKETILMIKKLSLDNEIFIVTDSDGPGKRIRDRVAEQVPNCKHIFIESNKGAKKPGVAEAKREDIMSAFSNIQLTRRKCPDITFEEYLEIVPSSRIMREKICKEINIQYANNKKLYKMINIMNIQKEVLINIVKKYS